VVLAAGEGTRMKSSVPKVLHPLCGRPMLLYVVGALEELQLERIVVVVGHASEQVIKTLQKETEIPLEFVEQRVQRGTGDAVSVGLTVFPDDLDDEGDIIVVPGDTPLLRPETLAGLSGLGDLVLTCSSTASRNFSLGKALGEGMSAAEALSGRLSVAEGAHTAPVLGAMARDMALDLPIVQAVCALLDGSAPAREVVARLLARPLRAEQGA